MLGKIPAFLRERTMVKKVAANTVWQIIDRFARAVVQLVMGVLIARHLGPAPFGLFNYAVAFVALFNPLATMGLDRLLIRDFVTDVDGHGKIMAGGFLIRAVGGMLILPISCLIVLLVRPGNTLLVELVAILSLIPPLQSLDVIDFWFQSRLDIRWVTFAKLLSLAISTAFRIGLLLWSQSLILFALASLTEAVFKSAALWLVYRPRRPSPVGWKIDRAYVRKLLSEAWPLALSLVFYFIYLRTDQILLGIMVGDVAVGIFSVAVFICDGFLFAIVILNNSVYPPLVSLYDKHRAKFWFRYEQITLFYTLAGWMVAVGLWLGRGPLIHFLYGPKYAQSANVLGISAFTLLFLLNACLRSSFLTISGQQKILLWGSVFAAALNVAVNLILIPRWGVMGAAWGTVIAQAAALFISNIFFAGTRPLFWLQARSLLLLPSGRKVMMKFSAEAA